MNLETKGYFIKDQLFVSCTAQAWTTGQFWTFYAHTAPVNNEDNKSLFIPIALTFHNFYAQLNVNNNTADGATLTIRNASVDGNGILTVDQATGFFEDTTSTDNVIAQGQIGVLYTQNDNSITVRTIGILAHE